MELVRALHRLITEINGLLCPVLSRTVHTDLLQDFEAAKPKEALFEIVALTSAFAMQGMGAAAETTMGIGQRETATGMAMGITTLRSRLSTTPRS